MVKKMANVLSIIKMGGISEKYYYIDGKENGEHNYYYPNGNIDTKTYCIDGVKTGNEILHKENGDIKEKWYYTDKYMLLTQNERTLIR